ncbi:hypothetical protein LTR86_005993 [Recurvomyces mirabilis]|nr:hypothetical protein LTR86_005993 [Recurvomyces mirabilis]
MTTHDHSVDDQEVGHFDEELVDLYANTDDDFRSVATADVIIPTSVESPPIRYSSVDAAQEHQAAERHDPSAEDYDFTAVHHENADIQLNPEPADRKRAALDVSPRRRSRPAESHRGSSKARARGPSPNDSSARYVRGSVSPGRDWSPPPSGKRSEATSSSQRPMKASRVPDSSNPFSPSINEQYYRDREHSFSSAFDPAAGGRHQWDHPQPPAPSRAYDPYADDYQYGATHYMPSHYAMQAQHGFQPVPALGPEFYGPPRPYATMPSDYYDRDTPSLAYMIPPPEPDHRRRERMRSENLPLSWDDVAKQGKSNDRLPTEHTTHQFLSPSPMSFHEPPRRTRRIKREDYRPIDVSSSSHPMPPFQWNYGPPIDIPLMAQQSYHPPAPMDPIAMPPPMPPPIPPSGNPAYSSRIYPYVLPPPPGYLESNRPVSASFPSNFSPHLADPSATPHFNYHGDRYGLSPDSEALFDIIDDEELDLRRLKRKKQKYKKTEPKGAPAPVYKGFSLEIAEVPNNQHPSWNRVTTKLLPLDDVGLDGMIKWHQLKGKNDPAKVLSQLTSAQKRAVDQLVSQEQTVEQHGKVRWVVADIQRFGRQRFGRFVETHKLEVILERQSHVADLSTTLSDTKSKGGASSAAAGVAIGEGILGSEAKKAGKQKGKSTQPFEFPQEPPLPPWHSEPVQVYRTQGLPARYDHEHLLAPQGPEEVADFPHERPQTVKSRASSRIQRSPSRARGRSRNDDNPRAWTSADHQGRRPRDGQRPENFSEADLVEHGIGRHDDRARADNLSQHAEDSQIDVSGAFPQFRRYVHQSPDSIAVDMPQQRFASSEVSHTATLSGKHGLSNDSLTELLCHPANVHERDIEDLDLAAQVSLPDSQSISTRFKSTTDLDGAHLVPLPLSVSPSWSSLSVHYDLTADEIREGPPLVDVDWAFTPHSRPGRVNARVVSPRQRSAARQTGVNADVVEPEVVGPVPPAITEHRRNRPFLRYTERVTALLHCMPHLKVLQSSGCRHPRGGLVTRMDYYDNINNPRRSKRKTFDHRHWLDASQRMRERAFGPARDPRVYLRVFLVEDLSPELINVLGSTFDVDPELFAEHLNRCGSRDHMYDETLPSRWKTNKMPKSYQSLRWYRPVRQPPEVLSWLQSAEQREKLYSKGVTWSDTTHERFDRTITEKRTSHCVILNTNICRQSWPLSARPLDGSSDTVAAAWEERVTVFQSDQNGVSILIMLLDPLPTLADQVAVETREFAASRFMPRAKVSNAPVDFKQKSLPAFLPMVPRRIEFPTNKIAASDDQIHALEAVASEASSTAADVESWIWNTNRSKLTIPNISADPLMAILHLAQIDCLAFLDSLEWVLDEINRDSLDDQLMTERLLAWRKLMSDLEIEVPAVARSLRQFIRPNHISFPEALPLLNELDARVASFMRRMASTYNSLRADMALLDSRKSIAEAQTVTKLTELAFAFVPLTFACSLFSMQVQELQNGAPLWTFCVTALALALASYAMRLLVQSGLISRSRTRVHRYAIAQGWKESAGPAPTQAIVRYLVRDGLRYARSGSGIVIFVSALVPTILPIAFLWARNHMDAGLNAMITILIVPAGLILAWYCALSAIGDSKHDDNATSDSNAAPLSTIQRWSLRVARLLPQQKASMQSSA